jgi:hypothetical protein
MAPGVPAGSALDPGTTLAVRPKEARGDATPFLPERRSLKSLREAAEHCRGCHLYAPATQTVFSDGPKRARVMMVRRDATALSPQAVRMLTQVRRRVGHGRPASGGSARA